MTLIESGRILRELRGETRIEIICATIGLCAPAMRDFERGKRAPNVWNRRKIAAYYGKTETEIWGEEAPNWR